MQIDMARNRGLVRGEPQGSAEALDPTAAVGWSEEHLLELATSLPAMQNDQAPATGPEAKDVPYTQEAGATSHALPSPMDQAT